MKAANVHLLVVVSSDLKTRAIPERFWGDDSQRCAISSVCTFTFIFTFRSVHHTDGSDCQSIGSLHLLPHGSWSGYDELMNSQWRTLVRPTIEILTGPFCRIRQFDIQCTTNSWRSRYKIWWGLAGPSCYPCQTKSANKRPFEGLDLTALYLCFDKAVAKVTRSNWWWIRRLNHGAGWL